MKYKKFDRNLHEQNDSIAKKKAIRYFKRIGFNVIENPDPYGIDLISDKFYVDVEVKYSWSGSHDNFKFDKLNIPYRKLKFTKLDMPSAFMVMNKQKTYAFVVSGSLLATCPKQVVSNKYEKEDEWFFKVPVCKCTKVNLGGANERS